MTIDRNVKKTETVYFRADAETLLNLHVIPEMGHPKDRIKESKPLEYQVTKTERLLFYKLLRIFDQIMKANGISYFIHSGTLLGSYRNHDIIPWDDDIDVFVNNSDRNSMRQVFAKQNISNLVLYDAHLHDKLYLDNESLSSSSYKWKWPYIDISFYNTNVTHIFDIAQTYGKYDTYPKSVIFPLTTRPFFNMDIPSPKDTFGTSVWIYGYSDKCIQNPYSHILENQGHSLKIVKCNTLKTKYPYVRRYQMANSVIEELIYNDTVIQRVQVNEPSYAISESFSFELQKGYQYPSNVELPKRNKNS